MFLLVTLAGVAAVVGSTKASEVLLVTEQATVTAGETLYVEVFAQAAAPVNAVSVVVTFPSTVEIIGVDKGESVITLWTQEPTVDAAKRTILLEGGTYNKGFIGKHKIATIRARAGAVGAGNFTVQNALFVAGDGRGTTLPSDVSRAVLATSVGTGAPTATQSAVFTATTVAVSDLDGDGRVSLADITLFMSDWAAGGRQYDMNDDGQSTFKDFSILLTHFFAS